MLAASVARKKRGNIIKEIGYILKQIPKNLRKLARKVGFEYLFYLAFG
jgi:hypothetical protein